MEFILHYWIEFGFGLITTILGIFGRKIMLELKENREKQNAIQEGVKSMLFMTIQNEADKVLHRGSIMPTELSNLETIYNAYKGLGGNGTAKKMYDDCCKLKITFEEEKEGV